MRRQSDRRGFTIVEVMIVTLVIGVLSLLAMPAFRQSRMETLATSVASDFRTFSEGFMMYAAESGQWCLRGSRGHLPDEMDGYIRRDSFEAPSAIGGSWQWRGPTSGQARSGRGSASLDIRNIELNDRELLLRIDEILDDGNLATGQVQGGGSHLSMTMESADQGNSGQGSSGRGNSGRGSSDQGNSGRGNSARR
jgi:prepilin-type N-terminal cleavage/methylation domain-containing protein